MQALENVVSDRMVDGMEWNLEYCSNPTSTERLREAGKQTKLDVKYNNNNRLCYKKHFLLPPPFSSSTDGSRCNNTKRTGMTAEMKDLWLFELRSWRGGQFVRDGFF